jgi:hypothetical protein
MLTAATRVVFIFALVSEHRPALAPTFSSLSYRRAVLRRPRACVIAALTVEDAGITRKGQMLLPDYFLVRLTVAR